MSVASASCVSRADIDKFIGGGGDDASGDISKTVVTTETYHAEYTFRYDSRRPTFGRCRYTIEYPVKLGGYDLGRFHRAINKFLKMPGDATPVEMIERWATPDSIAFMAGGDVSKWSRCEASDVRTPEYGVEYGDDDLLFFGVPSEMLEAGMAGFWPEIGLAQYRLNYYMNLASGTGAGENYFTTYMVYDLKGDRTLKLNDILTGSYRSVLRKQIHDYLRDHADEFYIYDGIANVEPSQYWHLDMAGGSIVFSYPKYEIGPGAAGVITVPVHFYWLKDAGVLTPLGASIVDATGRDY